MLVRIRIRRSTASSQSVHLYMLKVSARNVQGESVLNSSSRTNWLPVLCLSTRRSGISGLCLRLHRLRSPGRRVRSSISFTQVRHHLLRGCFSHAAGDVLPAGLETCQPQTKDAGAAHDHVGLFVIGCCVILGATAHFTRRMRHLSVWASQVSSQVAERSDAASVLAGHAFPG